MGGLKSFYREDAKGAKKNYEAKVNPSLFFTIFISSPINARNGYRGESIN
jgi:hypothetical protein